MTMNDRRPTRADARRNYALLLATARAAFMEQGAEIPLDDIAKRAGVGSATLYRHFPTRDDLLAAVLEDWTDGLLARAEELMRHPSPADALEIWLRAYLADGNVPRGASSLFAKASAMPGSCGSLGVSSSAICRAAGRLLVRAQRAGAVTGDVDAWEMLRLVNAIGIAAERADDPACSTARMLTLVMRGLRCSGLPARPEPGTPAAPAPS